MIYTTDVPRLGEGETSAVTLGKFDGLHRGHQKLMNCIREKKKITVRRLSLLLTCHLW